MFSIKKYIVDKFSPTEVFIETCEMAIDKWPKDRYWKCHRNWPCLVKICIKPECLHYGIGPNVFELVFERFNGSSLKDFLLTAFGPRVTVVARVLDANVSLLSIENITKTFFRRVLRKLTSMRTILKQLMFPTSKLKRIRVRIRTSQNRKRYFI